MSLPERMCWSKYKYHTQRSVKRAFRNHYKCPFCNGLHGSSKERQNSNIMKVRIKDTYLLSYSKSQHRIRESLEYWLDAEANVVLMYRNDRYEIRIRN